MTVEITTDDLKEVLVDSEVQALIIQKLTTKKTEGLADALTAQYKSLGIITDSTETASTSEAAADAGTAEEATASAEATA